MNLIFGIIIFIIGTLFGSFLTLAIYRIPLKKDITHERSFCPSCNHKLGFLDLIPVLSYILLKGKCRYCGEKVRIRYLLLEIFSGLALLLGFVSLDINTVSLDMSKVIEFISFIFIYVTIMIVSGIDKESKSINKSVIIFGVIMELMYIVYLCIVENANIYGYVIYLVFMFVLFLIDYILKMRNGESTYLIGVLMFCMYLNLCIGSYLLLIVAIVTAIISILYNIINQVKYATKDSADILNESIKKELPVGFFLGISTIIIIIIENFCLKIL